MLVVVLFPYDGLSVNDRNNYLKLDIQPQAQSKEDTGIDYHDWTQTNDPNEDYRHMRFIPNHYNEIDEQSAKFMTMILLQIQQKINHKTSFSTTKEINDTLDNNFFLIDFTPT